MWQRWSRTLERLGRLRFGFSGRTKIRVGDPNALDAAGGGRWREYRKTEALFDVWAPVAGSPWLPFHAVPLFAALDRISDKDIGPTGEVALRAAFTGVADEDARGGAMPGQGAAAGSAPAASGPAAQRRRFVLPGHTRPGAPVPKWADADSWIVLDLPGPAVVEAAVWLVTGAGCQPVCTFDNWPHPKGLLRPEDTLAELIRWASTLADTRELLSADAPPLWICDSERLGTRAGKPGEFDNRYYFDDSSIPGAALLRRAGIRRVIYVGAPGQELPLVDVEGFLADLLGAGLEVLNVDITDPALEMRAFVAPARPRKPPADFRRTSAGGFGSEVPQPSSGGSGG